MRLRAQLLGANFQAHPRHLQQQALQVRAHRARGSPPRRVPPAERLHRKRIGQTLGGSFSAVSRPNFARKYAFESSRRDLQNALLCTVVESEAIRCGIRKNPGNAAMQLLRSSWTRACSSGTAPAGAKTRSSPSGTGSSQDGCNFRNSRQHCPEQLFTVTVLIC